MKSLLTALTLVLATGTAHAGELDGSHSWTLRNLLPKSGLAEYGGRHGSYNTLVLMSRYRDEQAGTIPAYGTLMAYDLDCTQKKARYYAAAFYAADGSLIKPLVADGDWKGFSEGKFEASMTAVCETGKVPEGEDSFTGTNVEAQLWLKSNVEY